MLVLRRKAHERVVITGPGLPDIVIEVVDIRRCHSVALGVVAPPGVKVWRSELLPAGHPLHPDSGPEDAA